MRSIEEAVRAAGVEIPEGATVIYPEAGDLSFPYDKEHFFEFIENEDGDIYGLGHQDKSSFAAAVNKYYTLTSGGDPDYPVTEDHVSWRYGVAYLRAGGSEEEDWRFTWADVDENTPASFKFTELFL